MVPVSVNFTAFAVKLNKTCFSFVLSPFRVRCSSPLISVMKERFLLLASGDIVAATSCIISLGKNASSFKRMAEDSIFAVST